jgi:hypothetical protein
MSLPEGTNDMLCLKLRRFTIGQNCSATSKMKVAIETYMYSQWREALHFWACSLSLERSERWGRFFVIPVNSLDVDSTFSAWTSKLHASLWWVRAAAGQPAVRGVAYVIIGLKFVPLSSAQCDDTVLSSSEHAANDSCILATFSHDCDIKYIHVHIIIFINVQGQN